MVTQHAERGWSRTYVPTDINPFINYPPSPWERVYGKFKDLTETLLQIKGVKPQNKKTDAKTWPHDPSEMFREYQNGIRSFIEPGLLG